MVVSRARFKGVTLVEVLISLLLLSLIMMGYYSLSLRAKINTASLSSLNRNVLESEALFQQLRKTINATTRVNADSFNRRVTLNVMKPDYTYQTVIYRIVNVAGRDILETSEDGGTTWRPPYKIAMADAYRVTGEFLYCGPANNCTRFLDSNGNGTYQPSIDAAPVLVSGPAPALTSPAQATRILLSGFSFSRDTGNPPIQYGWPNIYLRLRPLTVWTSPLLVQGFSTNDANSIFNPAFLVRGIFWDARERRLLLVGHGVNSIYQVSRDGVGINFPGTHAPGIPGSQFDAIGFETHDGARIAYLLDSTAGKVYRYNMNTALTETTIDTTTFMTSPRAIHWDSGTVNEFYILGTVSGSLRILKRNKTTGAAGTGTNSWALPAGLTNPAGMTMDPASGAFYVVQNQVSGTGASRTIDIYRINPASPTTADVMTVNIADLGSVATNATTNFFDISYDVETNRLFMSDLASNRVFEFVPTRMLTIN